MKFRTAPHRAATAIVVVLLVNLALAFFIPADTSEPNKIAVQETAKPVAVPEHSEGLHPEWLSADPSQEWSSLDVTSTSRLLSQPEVSGKHSLQAYFKFAESKGVTLDSVPEDLLLYISEDPYGDLVMAIMFVESAFQPNSKTANNYGLMQIADVHFKEYARARPYITQCGVRTKKDLFDPHKNVCVGMSFFYELLEEHNMNRKKALMEYNASYRKKAFAAQVDRAYKEIVAYKTRLM